jgi:peptidoglycan hydrolase-like protein with peptidoglycan-binding domain
MVISKKGYKELLAAQEAEREQYNTQVKWIQQRLVVHGFDVDVDGAFGSGTEAMVEQFQELNDIAPSGVVAISDYTYNLLKKDPQPVTPAYDGSETEIPEGYLSKNFKLDEFKCRANGELPPEGWSESDVQTLGAAPTGISSELVERLEQLREMIGKPINITSGYRTPEYNKKVGGASKSQHLYGRAADITVSGMSADRVAELADSLFKDGGLGRYSSFTHVDVRGYYARW